MKKQTKESHSYASLTGFHRAVPIILVAVAVFTGLCFITSDIGAMGNAISGILLGLFSYGAYFIPFLIALHALFYPADLKEKRILSRAVFSLITVIFISALIYAVSFWGEELSFSVKGFYSDGKRLVGGGFVGSTVAFALIKIFGSVGLTVIAVAVFAIYLSYFFAGGGGSLKRLGLAILRTVVGFFAFFERGIKRIFSSPKRRRERKIIKENSEKTALLSDDEFFGVDNGMKRLEISELGIKETKSDKDAEERPILQEKVYHKSAAEGGATEKGEAASSAEAPKKRTVRSGHFTDLADTTEDKGEEPVVIVLEPDGKSISDSAEDVFTKNFDPYGMMSEGLARKPSSRSVAEGKVTVTEDISNITPEELERARRIADFERRKKAVIDAKRRNEAVPVNNAGEYGGEAKKVEFTEQKTDRSINETEAVSVIIDKQEQNKPVYTDMGFGDGFDFKEGDTIYSAEKKEEPNLREPEREAPIYREPREEAPVYSLSSDEAPNYTERRTEPAVGYNDAPIPSPVPEEKEYVFELGEDKTDTEDTEVETIRVERSTVDTGEFGADWLMTDSEDEPAYAALEDESSFSISDLPEEEDEGAPEEIPPEKQNPDVIKAREMFSFFKDEEDCSDESFSSDAEEEDYSEDDGDTLGFGSDASDEDYNYTYPADNNSDFEYDGGDEIEPYDGEEDAPTDIASLKTKPVTEEELAPIKKVQDYSNYVSPPLELLMKENHHDDEEIQAEINENTRVLIETLQSFNVTASIKGVDRGPRITRYEVVPARGVKVGQITHLFDDIKLYLAAEGIRMEAPIPGKSAIGFEIPNKHPVTVRLRELLECEEFVNAKSKTFVCIGKDVAGSPVFGDISKFPHALVAGATGMGKSVCINSLLISMLYKARPDEVKFIMIDPKKVEFKMYSGIPHLLIPVVTDPKQAAGALMWAVEEMERRYAFIEQNNIRNIESYNAKVAEDPSIGPPMPKIVIVIDELNDLMMQVRDPVEGLIMRIAQMARAAGIHLIIGTQRPDVKVITGTIKANINTRLSCKVTSVMDSRTILEMAGAEKLLDKGDMLFKPVDRTKPIRVQSAFVSDSEVEAIMSFLKRGNEGAQYDEEILSEINKAAQKCGNKKSQGGGADEDGGADDSCGYYNDQQFLDAVELAIRSGKVSTSLLQRRLSIGYGKAAKYIDGMEELGVVSAPNGNKPRDVLLSLDEWFEKLSRVSLD